MRGPPGRFAAAPTSRPAFKDDDSPPPRASQPPTGGWSTSSVRSFKGAPRPLACATCLACLAPMLISALALSAIPHASARTPVDRPSSVTPPDRPQDWPTILYEGRKPPRHAGLLSAVPTRTSSSTGRVGPTSSWTHERAGLGYSCPGYPGQLYPRAGQASSSTWATFSDAQRCVGRRSNPRTLTLMACPPPDPASDLTFRWCDRAFSGPAGGRLDLSGGRAR